MAYGWGGGKGEGQAMKPCSTCSGTGEVPAPSTKDPDKTKTCPTCSGTGEVTR